MELAHLECILLEIQVRKNKRILFGYIYRPSSSDAIYLFYIEDSFGLATDSNIADIVVTGDLNINALNDLALFLLELIFHEPTYYTKHSHSLLGLILISNPDFSLMYHCPVFGVLKFPKSKHNVLSVICGNMNMVITRCFELIC